MLAKRIIPTLLFRGETLVKGKQFNSWRSVGHVQQAARIYASRGVDELIILDIGATPEGRGPNLSLIEKICDDNFTPITVGGGIRSIEDVHDVLRAGADKVAIKTMAHELIKQIAESIGSQAVVGVVDYAEGDEHWAIDEAGRFFDYGAGEVMLTCKDREGMMCGYDCATLLRVARSINIPVIVHGGCGCYEDMLRAIKHGADAVAVGSMFQFCDETPRGAAQFLNKYGIEVRV
jgi:cyclase